MDNNNNTIPEINSIEPINTIEDTPVVPQAFSEAPVNVIEPTGDIYRQAYDAGFNAASAPAGTVSSVQNVDKLAVSCFVLGLSSLVMTWSTVGSFISVAAAIAGIILAACAKKKGSVSEFRKPGMTMSIIGLILGLITTVSCSMCAGIASSYEDMDPEELSQYLSEYTGQEFSEEDFGEIQEYVDQFMNQYFGEYGYSE